MRKRTKIIYILIIAVFLLSLVLFIMRPEKQVEEKPEILESIITFVSGEAYVINREGSRKTAEIGVELLPEYSLETMQDSYLEFQIGSSAVIRLDSNTKLSLSDLSKRTKEDSSSPDITMALNSGAIVQKVKKLTGHDKYNIITASAAFGVRGTEFLVKTSKDSDTLAVGEGSVVAMLYQKQLEKLKSRADAGDEKYKKIYDYVEKEFPVLDKGKEISIKKEDMENAAGYMAEVKSLMEKADAGEVSDNKAASLIEEKILSAVDILPEIKPEDVSEQNMVALKYAKDFQIEEEIPDTEVYIKTEPEDAVIYINDNLEGYGSLKALYDSKKIIKLRVEKEGYYPFEKEISPKDIKTSPYIVFLEKKSGTITLSAYPDDADIYIEGMGSFKGLYNGQFDPGTELSVTVERPEYITKKASYIIKEKKSLNERIILKPMLIPFSFSSGLESKGNFIQIKNNNVLSAGTGSGFSFFSTKGVKRWIISAEYSGNPLIAADKLFIVSGNTLEKLEFIDGSSSGTINILDSDYMDPEYYEGFIFINSSSDILKINPESLVTERTYNLPDKAVSNPYYYNGKLFSVTDKGVLHIYGDEDIAESAVSVSRGNPAGVDIKASGSTLYIAGLKGDIFAVSIKNGDFAWDGRFESDGTVPELSIRNNSLILKTAARLAFYSLSGELIFSPDASVDKWGFTESNELVYLTGGKTLVFCNSNDGSIIKQGQIEEGIADFAVSNGRIYAVKTDGSILVINPEALE